jgi:hypothetical protein
LPATFGSRDGLYLAGIEFLNSAGDLFVPFLLGGGVDGIVKAFEKGTS